MSMGLRLRLSLMMFLHYFVFGVWLPMIAQRMGDGEGGLHFSNFYKAMVFTVYGFGAVLGPFVIGQLADRYFSTERLLAVCQILGAFLLIGAAYAESFWPLFILLFLYCNLFMPSMGLTNSLSFRHASNASFASIRLWGTIGFIAAGWFFSFYLSSADAEWLKPVFDRIGPPAPRDCLRVAGLVSFVYGLYCLTLPNTPPTPANATDPIDKKSATLESLELMRDPSFAVLTLTSALIGIMLAFYFACENDFLVKIGTDPKKVGAYMTIGQIAELVTMLFVPMAVSKLGYKTTMIIGASAWAVRFLCSAIGEPWWLMIATIGFHGLCFGFFFVVAQMYVDRAAPADVKASAQNLLIFLIYGVGTIVGSLSTGFIRDYFANDWHKIWAGPAALTVFCILLFAVLFREKKVVATEGEPALVH